MVGLNAPSLVLLSLVALAVALPPSVAADLDDAVRPGPGVVESPADIELPPGVEEFLDRFFLLFAPVGPHHHVWFHMVDVDIECHEVDGNTECRGIVCFDDGSSGTLPVSLGDWNEGQYGVGVATHKGEDGRYSPYVGVFASPTRSCGCLPAVGVVWVLA